MTQRILLVDDEADVREAISIALKSEGFDVRCAKDGQDALQQMGFAPHVVLSDINMPNKDGFSLCREVRIAYPNVGFILVTARDDEIDEALGLELGADDYITKPFKNRILLARIRATLRRRQGSNAQTSDLSMTLGKLTLNRSTYELFCEHKAIKTTVSEFQLCWALAANPKRVHTREQLLKVLRDDITVGERLIDTYIRRLRKKIDAAHPGLDPFETVIGLGYRWTHH